MRAGVIFCGGALHVATGVRTSGCLLLIPSSCLNNADAGSGMIRYEARDNARHTASQGAAVAALRQARRRRALDRESKPWRHIRIGEQIFWRYCSCAFL
jgi:hypothetical protein